MQSKDLEHANYPDGMSIADAQKHLTWALKQPGITPETRLRMFDPQRDPNPVVLKVTGPHLTMDQQHQVSVIPQSALTSIDRPAFGWGWMDDDNIDRWIVVAKLEYDEQDNATLGEEFCTLMLRNADAMEAKFPGITAEREARARQIVDGLNRFYSDHTIEIDVEGGCVTEVRGLPDGWDYQLNDYDEPGEEMDSIELADQQRQFEKFSPPPEDEE